MKKRKGRKGAKFMFREFVPRYKTLRLCVCVICEICMLQSETAHQFDDNLVPFGNVWRGVAAVEILLIVQTDVRLQ